MKETQIRITDDILFVNIHGKYSLQRGKEILNHLIKFCSEKEISKLAIDIRELEGKISVIDRYHLASKLQEYTSHFIRIAFLITEEHQKPQKIFETVANNRGLYVFTSTSSDKVIEWLTNQTDNFASVHNVS